MDYLINWDLTEIKMLLRKQEPNYCICFEGQRNIEENTNVVKSILQHILRNNCYNSFKFK